MRVIMLIEDGLGQAHPFAGLQPGLQEPAQFFEPALGIFGIVTVVRCGNIDWLRMGHRLAALHGRGMSLHQQFSIRVRRDPELDRRPWVGRDGLKAEIALFLPHGLQTGLELVNGHCQFSGFRNRIWQ